MSAIKKKWKADHEEDQEQDESMTADSIVQSDSEEEGKDVGENVSEPQKKNDPPKKDVAEPKKGPKGPSLLKRADGEILMEKRKRFIPPAEEKLSEWLENNFEQRKEVTIPLTRLYKYYTEICQTDNSDVLDVPDFNKMVKLKFGKSFGLQASSIYKTVIKEHKLGEKKKSGTGIKWKDVLHEAINHFGNPYLGVRFFNLKNYIGARFPAYQVDSKPKILKRALEFGIRAGYIELARGFGLAGCYRLPGAVEPPKVKPKAKKDESKDEEESKAEEVTSGDGEKSADSEERRENGDSSNEKEHSPSAAEKDKASIPKKPKKIPSWSYSKISYSNPSKIEDTFPLAITYQSAPKAAGASRIRKYIQEKYNEDVADNRWRKTLETGLEKKYWEHVSGSGIAGKLLLLMDDFDPNSEELTDRICAAIIACHDPKMASSTGIKKYVMKYHTEFGIDQQPNRFKKALERAVEKKMIRQVSGIGAVGSFQLIVPFTPSPTVLAGEDDSDVESEDSGDDAPAYVPRGTKSRALQKPQKKLAFSKSDKRSSSAKSKAKTSPMRKGNSKKGGSPKQGRKRSLSPLSDEDDEDEVEYKPQKSRSRGGGKRQVVPLPQSSKKTASASKKGAKKAVKSKNKGSGSEEDNSSTKKSAKTTRKNVRDSDEEDEENEIEYTPRKSSSRGGSTPVKSNQKKLKGSPSKSKTKKTAKVQESEDEMDISEEDELDTPPRAKKAKKSASDSDEEDEVEYTPRKSSSRGGSTPVKSNQKKLKGSSSKSKTKKNATTEHSEDEVNFSEEDELDSTPPKSGSRGRVNPVKLNITQFNSKSKKKTSVQDYDSSAMNGAGSEKKADANNEDSDVELKTPPSKTKQSAGIRGRGRKRR